MNPNLIALIFGAGFLGLLAYIFRESNLASIPLIGVALLVVLWPLYEKLRTLIKSCSRVFAYQSARRC